MKKSTRKILVFLFAFVIAILAFWETRNTFTESNQTTQPKAYVDVREGDSLIYNGESYGTLNNNEPEFTADEITDESFEYYPELDEYGRCGTCVACIGRDIMPTEERGSIGMVKPTGWHTIKYDCVDGKYLYNRCHLIGFQLAGENANERNLITGTRWLNVEGMLPFENEVADYVHKTGNHVMYRVTPDFHGTDLVASGVQIEALSVEDNGEGVCFNVYCYNVQPGVAINPANGDSSLIERVD